jgi:hypothetical protein
MFFKKKKEVKKCPEEAAIKKITKLKKGQLNEETVVELNNIIKDYLKTKFRFIQSLTHEEIINKLEEKKLNKNLKIDLSHLLIQIYQKEYFPHVKIIDQEVDFLLKLAIKTLKEIEVGKKLKEEKIPKVEVLNEKKESGEMKRLQGEIESLGKDFNLDWKDPLIRKRYEKIRKDYSNLKDEEKKIIYPKIIALFKLKKT